MLIYTWFEESVWVGRKFQDRKMRGLSPLTKNELRTSMEQQGSSARLSPILSVYWQGH